MWPLLVEGYSQGEKATCSFFIAATMLHELGHAYFYAVQGLTDAGQAWTELECTQGPNSDDEDAQDALKTLGGCMHEAEWFWEGEPVAEVGFAVENQVSSRPPLTTLCDGGPTNSLCRKIFGGIATPIIQGSRIKPRWIQDQVGTLSLAKWPDSEKNQHTTTKGDRDVVLKTPASSVYKIKLPLAMSSFFPFFTQGFWDAEVQKYSHQALRIWPGTPQKVTMSRMKFKWRYVRRCLGTTATKWLRRALTAMKNTSQTVLWKWLDARTKLLVEGDMCKYSK